MTDEPRPILNDGASGVPAGGATAWSDHEPEAVDANRAIPAWEARDAALNADNDLDGWRCPDCLTVIEASDARRHYDSDCVAAGLQRFGDVMAVSQGRPTTGTAAALEVAVPDLLMIGANAVDHLLTALLPDRGNGDAELEAERTAFAQPYEQLAARMRGTADGLQVVEEWSTEVTIGDLSAIRHLVTGIRVRAHRLVTTPLWWLIEAAEAGAEWGRSVLGRDDVDDHG